MASYAPLSARENRPVGRTVQPIGVPTGRRALTPRARNPLLLRDDVGKAKPSAYDLPSHGFAYGHPGRSDVEGAREVSMHWESHVPSTGPFLTAPDFVALNKKATSGRMCNAKDLRYYRREHELLQPSPRSAKHCTATQRVKSEVEGMLPQSFAHGRKVRPSTPIGDVISNRFGDRAEHDLHRFYTDYREAQEASRNSVRKIPLTTASRGHASAAQKQTLRQQDYDTKASFKLSKFKRTLAKVENGRPKRNHDIPSYQLTQDHGDEDPFSGLELTVKPFSR